MKCPVCGKEMASGFLHTQKYPSWTQQERPAIFRNPKDLVSLRPRDDTADSLFTRDPFPVYPDTMLCQDCGIAVFPCKIIKE